ncbi:MAG: hypothetical protein NW208_02740 [Bryobacter sp.]|nr:hypothetical protein [Bryobacter sp.]
MGFSDPQRAQLTRLGKEKINAMYADEFVKHYHQIVVPEFYPGHPVHPLFGASAHPAPVREYSNVQYKSRHGISYDERVKLKNLLLYTFLPKMAKDPDTGIVKIGSGYRLLTSWAPIDEMPAKVFQRVIGGKGSPKEMAQFIQFLNYWRCHEEYIKGKKMDKLELIVEQYLGTDCNGFVGNYIKYKYPMVDVDPNNPEEVFHNKAKKKGGVIRKSIEEVAADDIVIFPGHIGVISKVLVQLGSSAMVVFCESKTRHMVFGGPQSNILHLGFDGKKFKLEDRKEVLAIIRLPGM